MANLCGDFRDLDTVQMSSSSLPHRTFTIIRSFMIITPSLLFFLVAEWNKWPFAFKVAIPVQCNYLTAGNDLNDNILPDPAVIFI